MTPEIMCFSIKNVMFIDLNSIEIGIKMYMI